METDIQVKYLNNKKAFLNQFPLSKMTGEEKFLALAVFIVNERTNVVCERKVVVAAWQKGILRSSYADVSYARAQKKNWVCPEARGEFTITEDGIQHLEDLMSAPDDTSSEIGLKIFRRSRAHEFDKYLRGVLVTAQKQVLVSDPYISESLFETLIDAQDPSIPTHLLTVHHKEVSLSFLKRYKSQFKNFALRIDPHLHDRFLVVDNTGYVIGSSLKSAADKSPTILVSLDAADSKRLEAFFQGLWSNARGVRV